MKQCHDFQWQFYLLSGEARVNVVNIFKKAES